MSDNKPLGVELVESIVCIGGSIASFGVVMYSILQEKKIEKTGDVTQLPDEI
ncbi:MAG: hypothetical protein RLN62_06975 [Rickettsiales bacterium]